LPLVLQPVGWNVRAVRPYAGYLFEGRSAACSPHLDRILDACFGRYGGIQNAMIAGCVF